MAACKWMRDEICVNADCPMCADYCPVPDTEGLCRYEIRDEAILALGSIIRSEADRIVEGFAKYVYENWDIVARELRRKIDADLQKIEALMKGGEADGD